MVFLFVDYFDTREVQRTFDAGEHNFKGVLRRKNCLSNFDLRFLENYNYEMSKKGV